MTIAASARSVRVGSDEVDPIRSPDGTVVSCHRSGEGPPLLLVHGTTADHTRWQGITAQLERQFTVWAMDRRGRGGSGDAPDYEIDREFEDVAAVVDAIGGHVAVLGHSYGAVCSLGAALLTDGIARMVLYEPPIPTGLPMSPPGVPDRMQQLIDSGDWERAVEVFFREVVMMPDDEFEQYRRLPVWKTRVQLAPTIPRELAIERNYHFEPSSFADLDIPIRLLLGGDSPAMFQKAVEAVEEALSGAEVVVLPGQQHIAMDVNPDLFLGNVTGFLAG